MILRNRSVLHLTFLFGLSLFFCFAINADDRVPDLKRFLEQKPAVGRVIFEKTVNLPQVPEHARTQIFAIRWQPEHYYMQVLGNTNDVDKSGPGQIYSGQFGSELWEIHNGNLTVVDPNLNTQATNDLGGVRGTEAVAKATLNMVLNLGVIELKPGTLTWNASGDLFQATTETGLSIVGALRLDNGLPSRIQLSVPPDPVYATIQYSYRSDFHGGQFPAEIARYQIGPNAKESEIFRIKMKDLEVPSQPFESNLFDPSSLSNLD
ncbi:MAG: hypothetical protein H0X66_17725 [Verrucomicrobia bacterium]|nr:hypothetical protein [Verrucomicrobiota bacterium]